MDVTEVEVADLELVGHVIPDAQELEALLLPAVAVLPAARNPYLVYIASLAKGESRRAMRGCLERIVALAAPGRTVETFPWPDLRAEHCAAVRALVEEQTSSKRAGQPWSSTYRNKHMAAMRGVLEQAWILGGMTHEEYQRARTALKDFKGSRLPAGRHVELEEFEKLLKACLDDESLAGKRDAALIALLYGAGLRRQEAVTLPVRGYVQGEKPTVRVIGKGDKERLDPVHRFTKQLLDGWLVAYEANVEAGGFHPDAAMFPPIHKSGKIAARFPTPNVVMNALNKRRLQAGLPKLTAHDMRRTFIGNLLDAGADLATVQTLAGHASPVTTARYDRRPERAREDAVNSLVMPEMQLEQQESH